MSDYTETKGYKNKGVYPVEVAETSELFRRAEPLITPELLVSRYLKGIPKLDFTPDEYKDFINRAANNFELDSGLTIERVQYVERLPFDRALYANYVYTKVNHKPVTSIESFHVTSSNGENIFKMPTDWIETGLIHRGQINVLPILTIFGTSGVDLATNTTNAGLVFLRAIANYVWLPAFWEIVYTSGLSKTDGSIPIVINEIIGSIAAIDILSGMQARILDGSSSIGQDGISQSISKKNGGNVYQQRILELTEKKDKLMGKTMGIFNSRIFMSNI
jgi:hypothetical protein